MDYKRRKNETTVSTKETVKPYYECKRCEDNSEKRGCWVPCPRGGCEARHIGDFFITKTTTKKFVLLTKPDKEFNHLVYKI